MRRSGCKTSPGFRNGTVLTVPNRRPNAGASAPDVRPWPSAAKAAFAEHCIGMAEAMPLQPLAGGVATGSRRLRFASLALALSASILAGSAARAQSHSHGYLFLAPGVVSGGGDSHGVIVAGVGGEGVFPGGLGLGAEVGGLKVRGGSDNGFGLGSLGGSFHVPRPLSTVDPFIAAGYTALFDLGSATSFFHLGGGANWWLAPHTGIKLEFRDYVHSGSGISNIATFRFGFAFH